MAIAKKGGFEFVLLGARFGFGDVFVAEQDGHVGANAFDVEVGAWRTARVAVVVRGAPVATPRRGFGRGRFPEADARRLRFRKDSEG
jgi:hypothetical protein